MTSREMDSQLPHRVTIKHMDVDREYEIGSQYAGRLNTPGINQLSLDLPLVLTATEAAGKAEVLLYHYWLGRHDVAFSLPASYLNLECGYVVTLAAQRWQCLSTPDLGHLYQRRAGRVQGQIRPRSGLYAYRRRGRVRRKPAPP